MRVLANFFLVFTLLLASNSAFADSTPTGTTYGSYGFFFDTSNFRFTNCQAQWPAPNYSCWLVNPTGSTTIIYYSLSANACPEGESLVGNQCITDPPQCGVDDGKSPEQCSCEESSGEWSGLSGQCFLTTPDDDQQQCESGGGTWGSVNNVNVCLAEDYGAPTCSAAGNIATYQDSEGGSGWACEPDASFPDPDSDGDGTPDRDDTDIDGDGIANDYDPDIDGDGTPNESDDTPSGSGGGSTGTNYRLDQILDNQTNAEEREKQKSVSGGDSCDSAPSCSGDVIQCALVTQQWKTRCEAPFDASDVNNELSAIEASATSDLLTLTSGDTFDVSSELNVNTSETASCPPAFVLPILSTSVEVSLGSFCTFADTIRPLVIAMGFLLSGLMFVRST